MLLRILQFIGARWPMQMDRQAPERFGRLGFRVRRRRHAFRFAALWSVLDLIKRYGANAYGEARLRRYEAPQVVDANGTPGYWERVKDEIRCIQGRL
jgi:hypothetical protein